MNPGLARLAEIPLIAYRAVRLMSHEHEIVYGPILILSRLVMVMQDYVRLVPGLRYRNACSLAHIA